MDFYVGVIDLLMRSELMTVTVISVSSLCSCDAGCLSLQLTGVFND